MSDDKGLLSRWSERKQRVAEEVEVAKTQQVDKEQAQEPDPFEGKTDDEILQILELPAPEDLALGDRAEGYLAPNVPEHIRQRALRAFWRTNPVLANLDGLDDYCDDFTDAAMVVENMQTIYEVGRGYAQQAMDALESFAEESDELMVDAANQLATDAAPEQRADPPEEIAVANEPDQLGQVVQADSAAIQGEQNQGLDGEKAERTPYKPRRMQFGSA
jgi:hypothetical protein